MVMISIPMNNVDWKPHYKEIEAKLKAEGYNVAPLYYKEMFGQRAPDFVEGLYVQSWPLVYMSHAFLRMALCDTIYFCKGWSQARGCRIEYLAAKAYGLKCIFENETDPV